MSNNKKRKLQKEELKKQDKDNGEVKVIYDDQAYQQNHRTRRPLLALLLLLGFALINVLFIVFFNK